MNLIDSDIEKNFTSTRIKTLSNVHYKLNNIKKLILQVFTAYERYYSLVFTNMAASHSKPGIDLQDLALPAEVSRPVREHWTPDRPRYPAVSVRSSKGLS